MLRGNWNMYMSMWMPVCLCMSDPEEETERGYLAFYVSALLPRNRVFHWSRSFTSVWVAGQLLGSVCLCTPPPGKVALKSICINALLFTQELESSCLHCTVSPALKEPFKDKTWTGEYSPISDIIRFSPLTQELRFIFHGDQASSQVFCQEKCCSGRKSYLPKLPLWRCVWLAKGGSLYTIRNMFMTLFKLRQ